MRLLPWLSAALAGAAGLGVLTWLALAWMLAHADWRRARRSVRQQQRHRGAVEHVARRPAEDPFAHPVVTEGSHDDQVHAQIGGP
jgi:hypothetical protein